MAPSSLLHVFFSLAGLLSLLGSVFAMPDPRLSSRQTVLLPDVDPFYAAPAGLSSAKPGDILRSRPVPYPIAAFNTAVVNLKDAYQILYRTTDSNGQPEAAMTTLLIPYKLLLLLLLYLFSSGG
ncbi:hypothetical protein V502_07397 [Pseudogymnoascus sp. VKM F-4520 (FW-2644)]|nr:hypothetical protein V502_07397 [Pseudogymnoascus sp. VKM F-4520 (FW-2644)]